MSISMTPRIRRSAVTTLSVLLGVVGAAGVPAAASAAAPDCNLTRTLCLWENPDFAGARFTAQAANASTGTCVDLAAHGWGAGRAESALNTANRPAVLYANSNCTGNSYQLMPFGSYSPVTFGSNSVYVY